MQKRTSNLERKTKETDIAVDLDIDGTGRHEIATGIGFFDHMLTLFAVHGFFDLKLSATGDIHVDYHHTVEDVGIVLGDAFKSAVGDKKGVARYGYAVTPMDDALGAVAVDLSGRPFLVYLIPDTIFAQDGFNVYLAKEFFRAFSVSAGINLHIQVKYGENDHHALESVFKSFARSLDAATRIDERISKVHSSKGRL